MVYVANQPSRKNPVMTDDLRGWQKKNDLILLNFSIYLKILKSHVYINN